MEPYFSYDGLYFRSQADAEHEHPYTSLANTDGSPLIVGGANGEHGTNKVEMYEYSTNTWTELAHYPYHNS